MAPVSGCRGQVAAPASSGETGGAYGETSTSRRWPTLAGPSRRLRWPVLATSLGVLAGEPAAERL